MAWTPVSTKDYVLTLLFMKYVSDKYAGKPGADARTDVTGSETFDGNRWNDFHYTNAMKRAARYRAEEAVSA